MSGTSGESDGGAAGDVGTPSTPLAIYPLQFNVDVNCGQTQSATTLLIQNGGAQPLTISSASVDSDYLLEADFPLSIAAGDSAVLLVTAPAPESNAQLGAMSSGTSSFTTNEPTTPTHHITLHSTLFGGSLEFLDSDGKLLPAASLTLGYSSEVECPDSATYRVHNTGNLAFRLSGPTFPARLGGTTTGSEGVNLAPDAYAELQVGASAASGDACSGSGLLTFDVGSGFCGAAPHLNVIWPAGSRTSCVCTPPTSD